MIKIFSLSLMGIMLCSCHQHNKGLSPTELQEYVAKVDAEATVKDLKPHQQSVAITPKLQVRPLEQVNNIYLPDGSLAFSGQSAEETQLVQINPDGSMDSVSSFNGNPYGSYIAFTPPAFYHINRSTGQSVKVPRGANAAPNQALSMRTSAALRRMAAVMDDALGKGI
ncbi:MAG: hypothetical protein R3Y56_08195 [Akkermansia sp.]